MSYAIILFILFALAHFVYESIIAPVLRAQLRCELYDLKKEIEQLKMIPGVQEEKRAIQYLRDAVNNLVQKINSFEIVSVMQAVAELEKDKKLSAHLEERIKTLDTCESAEIQRVWEETISLAKRIFNANSRGWDFYVVPILVSVFCIQKMHQIAKTLLSMPAPLLEKVSPGDGPMILPA